MSIRIEDWQWDDGNIDELWNHGIRPGDVEALLETQQFIVIRNKNQRSGKYKLVGKDRGGRLITVVITAVAMKDGLWRPITGWPSTSGELTKWERNRL